MLGNFGKFDNGTICFIKQTDGGFDDNGNGIEALQTESQTYPCHIVVNTNSKKGKNEDGRFQVCSYEIYMDKINIDADIVKLTREDKFLGKFEIQTIIPSKLLNRIKIFV